MFSDFLQRRHTEQEAAALMRCLMEFIAFMHSKGLTHRDLKPENIMLSSSNQDAVMKVIDFGTSDFCPEGRRLFHKFGTPMYVAPEVRWCTCYAIPIPNPMLYLFGTLCLPSTKYLSDCVSLRTDVITEVGTTAAHLLQCIADQDTSSAELRCAQTWLTRAAGLHSETQHWSVAAPCIAVFAS